MKLILALTHCAAKNKLTAIMSEVGGITKYIQDKTVELAKIKWNKDQFSSDFLADFKN